MLLILNLAITHCPMIDCLVYMCLPCNCVNVKNSISLANITEQQIIEKAPTFSELPCSKQKAIKFLTHVYPEIISKDWINHKCIYNNSTLTTNLPTERTTNANEQAQGEEKINNEPVPADDGNTQLSEDELEEIETAEKGDSHTTDDNKSSKGAKRKSKEIENIAKENELINKTPTNQKQNGSKKPRETNESTSSKTPIAIARSTQLLNKAKITPTAATAATPA